jgi:hypothetical protein
MRVVGDRIALFRNVVRRLMPATSHWHAKVDPGNAQKNIRFRAFSNSKTQ